MRNKLFIIGAAVCAVAITVLAASPRFKSMSANGNATTGARVIFPADPSSQIRIVNANFTTDTNNSVLSFSGGSTAYSIQETNLATSSVTNKINSTNGLSGSAVLVLQHGGVCYYSTVASWAATTNSGSNGGTNVVLASGGWGVVTTKGDSVYLMDTPVTIPAGTTAAVSGYSIYAATYSGRPVLVQLTPALATNKLNSVTAIYE